MSNEEFLEAIRPLVDALSAQQALISVIVGLLHRDGVLTLEDVADGLASGDLPPGVKQCADAIAKSYRDGTAELAAGKPWPAAHLTLVPKE